MTHYVSEAPGVLPHLVVGFNQVLSTENTNHVLSKIAHSLLDKLSPEGWSAAGLHIADSLISGDLHNLCDYDPDALDLGAHDVFILRQCLAFFNKRRDIDLGVDREDAARTKFWQSEASCRLTNSTFTAWNAGRFQFRPAVEGILHASARKISKLLGPAPSISDLRIRFGPGANTQTPKQNACLPTKWRNTPACSSDFEHLLTKEFFASFPHLVRTCEEHVEIPIHVARLSFVPKNAKIDRAICTEPALNGMFQLGLGDVISQKLHKVGIDIRDQSANQRAALYYSISDRGATVDLSSASDTIALKLVEHLLPDDWFSLICAFRTSEVLDQGKYHRLDKVSSMGNGFTFPLETLIFWALAQSCSDTIRHTQVRVLVYGDDIVIDSQAWPLLRTVLSDLGFTPNTEKTFASGPFRESCGKDYILGHLVRPVFVSDRLTGADFFRLHNFFFRLGDFTTALLIERFVEPSVRLRGPDGYGDGHFLSTFWVSRPAGRKKGWDGFTFETYSFKSKDLKSSIARTFLTKESSVKGGKLCFQKKHFPLVKTIAVYQEYLRSDFPEMENTGGRDPYLYRHMPTIRSGGEHLFSTPGRSSVRRIKIYTFEPPRFMN